ncbi:DUF952 domain-containing protein [Aurantimonas sp. Leaf443]|uniref:DUF952 domain-containing protein n=1 Tax=Aurantimonas sp. Leaf443 TaxID=1736378 RepID=UPI0006F98181|nr:DUF952 domain-containing protein [Aurantimonas sp. Leaf443]KQT85772.1 dihydroorotate dehydrogenase [Aurantimonas sp. Leaf443]
MDPIYKIVPKDLWIAARDKGRFDGAPVDESDGFIHFSNGAQVRDTAARHFAGQDGLLLVAVDPERLGAALKHEPSRGGALFPHLYGPLPMDAVLWVEELGLGADGHHQFPGSIR